MKLTDEQQRKVDAEQWFVDDDNHVKVDVDANLSDPGGQGPRSGTTYTTLSSPWGAQVSGDGVIYKDDRLDVTKGTLKVAFGTEKTLRHAMASFTGRDGHAGKLQVSACDKDGKVLASSNETLTSARSSVLFENVPGVVELRFKGDAFAFLMARAAGPFSLDPPTGGW